MIKFFFITILATSLFTQSTLGEKINIFEFTQDELKTLEVKKVKRETKWILGSNEKGN